MKVISKQTNSKMCFICGMDNPIGLKAQFYNMEDESVMTRFMFKEEHQSFPMRVHGGLIATMQDELGLRAIWAKKSEDIFGVTMDINVKFRKPAPYNEILIGKGIVTKMTNMFAQIETKIFDLKGNVISNATMKYIIQPVSKIASDTCSHEEMCYLIKDDITEINFE